MIDAGSWRGTAKTRVSGGRRRAKSQWDTSSNGMAMMTSHHTTMCPPLARHTDPAWGIACTLLLILAGHRVHVESGPAAWRAARVPSLGHLVGAVSPEQARHPREQAPGRSSSRPARRGVEWNDTERSAARRVCLDGVPAAARVPSVPLGAQRQRWTRTPDYTREGVPRRAPMRSSPSNNS